MKFEIRSDEIEMEAENEQDQRVLEILHRTQILKVKDGRSRSERWPPPPKETNIVLVIPRHEWGT